MSIFRHLNIVVWASEITECPQLPLISEGKRGTNLWFEKFLSCRLGRHNQGKYHCILAVLWISPYTAAVTQIRPELQEFCWDDTAQHGVPSHRQTQAVKIAILCKNSA